MSIDPMWLILGPLMVWVALAACSSDGLGGVSHRSDQSDSGDGGGD